MKNSLLALGNFRKATSGSAWIAVTMHLIARKLFLERLGFSFVLYCCGSVHTDWPGSTQVLTYCFAGWKIDSVSFYCRVLLKKCLGAYSTQWRNIVLLLKSCLDGILPSSVSNLRWDYHNPLPAKLVHTQKINHRRLMICWKTRW